MHFTSTYVCNLNAYLRFNSVWLLIVLWSDTLTLCGGESNHKLYVCICYFVVGVGMFG